MDTLSFDISDPEKLTTVCMEIIAQLTHKVLLFKGELGAGKTTFIQHFIHALGSTDHASSPTYALVNEYTLGKEKIYHFDLYRLSSIEEVYDIGIQDYLDSGHYCLIEWPEIFEPELEENYHEFSIFMHDKQRNLICKL